MLKFSLRAVDFWTDSTDSSCFSFFLGMSVLTLALCARLVSFQVHIKSLHIIIMHAVEFCFVTERHILLHCVTRFKVRIIS